MIIRVEHDADNKYTSINRTGANDDRLSLEARGGLFYFLTKPDGWKANADDLAKQGGCGKQRAYRILKELELAGYLVRRALRNAQGKIVDWEADIYETPQHTERFTKPKRDRTKKGDDVEPDVAKPQVEKPQVDEPDVALPHVVLPQVEKPQLNDKGRLMSSDLNEELLLPAPNETDGDDAANAADSNSPALTESSSPATAGSERPTPTERPAPYKQTGRPEPDHDTEQFRLCRKHKIYRAARFAHENLADLVAYFDGPGRDESPAQRNEDLTGGLHRGLAARLAAETAMSTEDLPPRDWLRPVWQSLSPTQRDVYARFNLVDGGLVPDPGFEHLRPQVEERFRTTTARILTTLNTTTRRAA